MNSSEPRQKDYEYDAFLSHSSKDKPRVTRLAERLKAAGVRVWFDSWNIRTGEDILLAIEEGLKSARIQIVCMSPTAFQSDWVGMERRTVLFRDPSNTARRFIPLLLADCEIPDAILRFKYVDYREEGDEAFEEVLKCCKEGHRERREGVAQQAVRKELQGNASKPNAVEKESGGIESSESTQQDETIVEEFRRRQRSSVVTFVFTEIVGVAQLMERKGDACGVAMLKAHHGIVTQLLTKLPSAKEIRSSGESMLLVFSKPSDAVRFSLCLLAKIRASTSEDLRSAQTRIGIHFGEVMVEKTLGMPDPRNIFGKQVRVGQGMLRLAGPDQILTTRSIHDNASQILKGEIVEGLTTVTWKRHGFYILEGIEEPQEIFEVGEETLANLSRPRGVLTDYPQGQPNAQAQSSWRQAIGSQSVVNSNAVNGITLIGSRLKNGFMVDGNPAILLQNCDGFLAVWALHFGAQVAAQFLKPTSTGDAKWSAVGHADFDGDNNCDILFQHVDGTMAVWLMDGLNLKSAQVLNPSSPGDCKWHVVGVVDLDKDGNADILFQHEDGTLAIWYMEGVTLRKSELVLPNTPGSPDWKVVAVGDVSGHSGFDILFQHSDGRLLVWIMDGNKMVEAVPLCPEHPSDPGWRVRGLADFDGDGKSDLLLEHGDGRVAIWFMNGINLRTSRFVNPKYLGKGWRVAGPKWT